MKLFVILMMLVSLSANAKLTHESEFSSVATGGNSDVQTYLARTNNVYELLEKNTFRFGGHYTYGESNADVSARDWDANGKYERALSEKTAVIAGEIIEGYRFQGIKARYNSDLGFKYYYIKSDPKNFFSELGYRYTIEDRYSPESNQNEHKARFFNEFNHKYSETLQYRLWAEYVPNFTDNRDYLVNFEGSITSILTSIFSLKVAYRGLYDSVPAVNGNANYDYNYTTSILAKF